MSEKEAVEKSKRPITKKSLVSTLKAGGVKKGDTVIVHSSLSSLGWVCGGPITVIQSLMKVITEKGTLVMPTHNGSYSDPENWQSPSVPEKWYETIRKEMPAFQPEITPTRGVGVIPENFRKFPGVKRSKHPNVSFAAWGKNKEEVIADHQLDFSLGENSPLADIYKLRGKVLLIGVDHDRNTSLHYAEYVSDCPTKIQKFGAPIIKDGERTWAEYEDIVFNSDDFKEVGKAYEKQAANDEFKIFEIGNTKAKLLPQKKLVDFASNWFEKNR